MMTQTELIVDLCLILLFFTGSWFFSGFESGMISLNRYRLVRSIRNGDPNAKALANILHDTHRLLATTLVGNNICNVTLSTLSAALAVAIATALGLKGPIAQTVATVTVAILLLIVGEFLPKLWFTARPIERCAPLLPIFRVLRTLLAPLASLCILLTRLVTGREKEKRSPFVSRENIAFLMRDSEANGEVSPFERLMVSRVLDLQFKRAAQLMTPLHAISRINHDESLDAVLKTFRQTHHRILPVFKTIHRETQAVPCCIGVLHLFDLLRSSANNPLPSEICRQVHCVSEHEAADNLLLKMRENKTKMLLVCKSLTDAEGHPLHTTHAVIEPIGLVTLEDVLKAVLDDELLRSSTNRQISPTPKEND